MPPPGFNLHLQCVDGEWVIHLISVGGTPPCDVNCTSNGKPNTNGCPPTGAYTFPAGPCSGVTVTIS